MKITRNRMNRRILRAKSPKALSAIITLVSLVAIGTIVFAASKGSGIAGGAGAGGNRTGTCTSGNCKSVRKNGAFWIRVDNLRQNYSQFVSRDSIPPGGNFVTYVEQPGNITGCINGGNAVYILVTQLSGGGLAGPVNSDTARRSSKGILSSMPSGVTGMPPSSRFVSPGEAQSAFAKNADFYLTKGQRWEGTGLGWFCADPKNTGEGEETLTPEPPEPENPSPVVPWFAKDSRRRYGATASRIAVENMSVDGITQSTNSEWKAGIRSGPYADYAVTNRRFLHTDSGPALTDYDDNNVETIAKPGDSIRFLHQLYMGNRYVRMATDYWEQDQYIHGYMSPNYTHEIPGWAQPYQTANITGRFNGSENYNFTFPNGPYGNNIGIVNAMANNAAYGDSWFYSTPFSDSSWFWANSGWWSASSNSVSFTGDNLGVSVISPSSNNNNYRCDLYTTMNPFIEGGFQIPGYKTSDLGFSCISANLVGTTNLVGQTFGQQHEITNVKAWEAYHHNIAGSCGCNTDTYNYTYVTHYYDGWGNETSTSYEYRSSYGTTNRDARLVGNYDETTFYTNETNGQRQEWSCQNEPSGDCQPVDVARHIHADRYETVTHTSYCEDMYGWEYECGTYDSWEKTRDGYETTDSGFISKSYENTYESYNFKYRTRVASYGNITKTATVRTPYNFLTSVSSNIGGSILFQGSQIDSSFNWSIDPRDNNYISSFPYATITPENTEVRMIEFMYEPGARDASGASYEWRDPCSFYNSKGAVGCSVIKSDVKSFNDLGLYDGQSYSHKASRIVPDDEEYVGYKYCVAIGINYTSSHPKNSSNSQSDQYAAMNPSTSWNISNASCRPIAKKPNFQVWNGSIYTKGEVNTSISEKAVGVHSGDYNKIATTLFGSWTDYMIIAGKEVSGMASGAALGYNNSSYNLGLPGGHSYTSSMKNISPETIRNNRDDTGFSNIDASVSINNTLNRLKSRYKEKAKSFANEMGSISQKRIRTAPTGMQYINYDGNLNISEIEDPFDYWGRPKDDSENPNHTTYRASSGEIYKKLGNGKDDNTLVIYVNGTLTIDRNICLSTSDWHCKNYDATQLISYNDISTNASSTLPQILIFANNINITQDVTRIDAWLIVDQGTLNTCSEFNLNSYDGTRAFKSYGSWYGNYDYVTTANGGQPKCFKTLVVNGPVFAGSLRLYRTAGSYHGGGEIDNNNVLYRSVGSNGEGGDPKKGSISPAEIFNLRADAYIWAYNQAERYSEAVVTYTRELAPRY